MLCLKLSASVGLGKARIFCLRIPLYFLAALLVSLVMKKYTPLQKKQTPNNLELCLLCFPSLPLSHTHTHLHTCVHTHIDRLPQNTNLSMCYNKKPHIFLMMLFCHPLSSRNSVDPGKHMPGLSKCEKLSKRYKCFHLPCISES